MANPHDTGWRPAGGGHRARELVDVLKARGETVTDSRSGRCGRVGATHALGFLVGVVMSVHRGIRSPEDAREPRDRVARCRGVGTTDEGGCDGAVVA